MEQLLKMWTIRDAILIVCDAGENIPSSKLNISWVKIFDQDYNEPENLEDEYIYALTKSIPDFVNVDKDR